MTVQVRIALLGRFEVSIDADEVDAGAWTRRHATQLVQLLALAPGRHLHREQVMDALWPDVPLADAGPRLHKAAHYARRALGDPGSVVLTGDQVHLLPGQDVDVDAVAFEAAAVDALRRQDAEAAGTAADLYDGDLLPDDRYDAWVDEPRERLRMLHLDVLRLAGRWADLARAEPADEQAHVELARTAAAAGDLPAALRHVERLERALRRELGTGPSRAVVALRERLRAAVDRAGTTTGRPRDRDGVVGRDREVARLERLLAEVHQGRGQALFVSGPQGIGTSTILLCLERRAVALGMRVGTGTAAPVDAPWPYAPVLEALSDLCRRHPALLDGLEDPAQDELRRALAGRDLEWDGRSSHQRLYVAAAELLRLAAAGEGAVLVVDDLDQADDASLQLLHYLARATAGDRVLVATAHRPEASGSVARMRSSLLARDQATTLDLRPLSDEAATALVRRHVQDDAVVHALLQAAGGVPYVLVESARAAARGDQDPLRALLPDADGAREVLDVAALLGTTFSTDELVAAVGRSDDEVTTALDQAVARGTVVRTETGPEFRHALVREALLQRLPDGRRRALHSRIAAALRASGAPAARVAHHLLAAGHAVEAVPWVLAASETLAALGAYRDALTALDQVDPRAAGVDRARLAIMRADLLMALADPAATDAYRDALGLVSEPTEIARVRTRLARAALFAGDLATAGIALEGLEPAGIDQRDDAELLVVRGQLHLFSGDVEGARHDADLARRSIAVTPHASSAAFELVTFDGLLAHHRGEWFSRLRGALRSSAAQPTLATSLFDSHLCVAEYLLYGPTPYAEVRELAYALRETAERSGVLRAVAFAVALAGEAAFLAGDLATAERELEEAAALHRETGAPAGEAHALQRLAEVHLAAGDRERAVAMLTAALPLARWSMVSSCLLPRIYGTRIAAATDPQVARAEVDQAVAGLGVDDRCPFCTIAFDLPAARACAAAGDLAAAHAHLAAAAVTAARWNSAGWDAALLEARSAVRRAEGAAADADVLRERAAALFAASGQVLDARRCAAPA